MRGVRAPGYTIWLTGLSGAGKTTTALAVRDELLGAGQSCVVIDGDDLRQGLSSDLGFGALDRDENVRRAGELALLVGRQGLVAIVAMISPRSAARRTVRERHNAAEQRFVEVYLDTPLSVCERRDPKSLYRRARAGEELHLTGVNDPYEAPERAELVLSTEEHRPDAIARLILATLR